MDGIHDLGGMQGFGRIPVEDHESRFQAPWEGRVAGMFVLLLLQGRFNIDAFRHGIETLAPLHYLRASYFERWRTSVETQLVRGGVITAEELEDRVRSMLHRPDAASQPPKRKAAPPEPQLGPVPLGFIRAAETAPRFRVGDAVRARNLHPAGHTRLPGYVRGKRGRVVRPYPAFVFPDTNAHGQGENPQTLYNVRFDGREVWGNAAEPGTSVGVDLFESYLEPA